MKGQSMEVELKCPECAQLFLREERILRKNLKRGRQNFCSLACVALYNGKLRTVNKEFSCKQCGASYYRKPFEVKNANTFCSRQCYTQWQIQNLSGENSKKFISGIFGYRQKALRHYGAKCSQCGYDKYLPMIEVHHKDGNRQNNHIDNLEVLCAWCHHFKTLGIPFHEWDGHISELGVG